jgi:Uma2 family endonuclease
MVTTPIPRWLAKLDEQKPYIEVLDGERLPYVDHQVIHGRLAIRIGGQLDEWADDHGRAGVAVRFYFLLQDGRWSSLLPDVQYTSYARVPNGMADTSQRPRVAPDVAVEILSPDDPPGRVQRTIETYLKFGATLVLVLHATKRRATLHRSDGTVEERSARGTWSLPPFDGLVLDWEKIYRGIEVSR